MFVGLQGRVAQKAGQFFVAEKRGCLFACSKGFYGFQQNAGVNTEEVTDAVQHVWPRETFTGQIAIKLGPVDS